MHDPMWWVAARDRTAARVEELPTKLVVHGELLIFQGWQRLQYFRRIWAAYHRVVFADFAVAEDERTFRELRNAVFVRHQHNRQSLII